MCLVLRRTVTAVALGPAPHPESTGAFSQGSASHVAKLTPELAAGRGSAELCTYSVRTVATSTATRDGAASRTQLPPSLVEDVVGKGRALCVVKDKCPFDVR